MVILVTGANGQLGQSLQMVAKSFFEPKFVFCTSSELDITNLQICTEIFEKYQPNYCINSAAYTAVDKAEAEPEKAKQINEIGSKNLAENCKKTDCILLHISTDFVFDGNANQPYSETDLPNPTGIYAKTKLDGEIAIQNTWHKHFIIRTSWVYSPFGNNFMKTMLRLASEREELSVVSDQIGTPTNAIDLANALLKIIFFVEKNNENKPFGLYHFSNLGQCSWYDFAKEIFKQNHKKIVLNPIPTTAYPTPAKRPKYSVLDKAKIQKTFDLEIKNWEESLQSITEV